MPEINLSYVLTTYNKYDFLKIVLDRAIQSRGADEEIIVVDGGSSDNTSEYLQNLFSEGKIQKFVTEKDFGEGHGYNKGLLMAEGKLIKLLTDDDAFDFRAIGRCKEYMLENMDVDFLNTHGGWYDIRLHNEIHVFTEVYLTLMSEWKEKGTPFASCLLGAMLNRKSLPYLGLLNPHIKRADAEYSLRITAQKIKMAWYLGASYVRVLNQQSNSIVYYEAIQRETLKLNAYYDVFMDYYRDDPEKPSIKTYGRRILKKAHSLLGSRTASATLPEKEKTEPQAIGIEAAFDYIYSWLHDRNEVLSDDFVR